ncbi:Exocyst complex protein [Parasponia andersonii]|uniref:Exocyst subunit Exo70 family protein n=1 Tax=Parasponia andersonii TaxID=3476 RepID=A0A2P5DHS1_PARAD|nr:Exocyst complex protein [Parasponia andersonii]
MRSLCFQSKTPSSLSISRFGGGTTTTSSSPSPQRTPVSTPTRRSITDSMMGQIIDSAAPLILKWDPESSNYAKVTSLFYESKSEAQRFIKCVDDLQKAMHFLVTEDSSSEKLILAQTLMQVAMKRLQKEFYQILSMNRAYLDPESVSARSSRASARSSTSDYDDDGGATTDEDVRAAGDSISEVEQVSSTAMAELRSIAECMISAGYAKECVNIYKIIRKSIIDEGIYRMGVEKLSASQINKTDWEVLELRIKNWLDAVKISMRTLFHGERILCDHVFAVSDSIRESCFSDISREGALLLFGFPELVAKSKKIPEKIFRVLDMYNSIFENWPEIEAIFAFESTAVVRTQAYNSLVRMAEFVRAMLSDFEASIQRNSSSSKSPAHGGGVHRLTVHAMSYLSLLADYSGVLVDIFRDWLPPANSSVPESFFDSSDSDESPAPAISVRVAWLILVLLCKLDGRAKHYYDDVSLSYLFLANNLNHVVTKVRTSNLQYLLGEEWASKHEAKVRQFASNYERLGWGHVIATLPESPSTAVISPEEAKTIFRNFNWNFEQAYRKQRASVVPDPKLRDEIKASLAGKLVSAYREFHETHRITVASNSNNERQVASIVKFTPEDVGNYLSDLFYGMTESEGSSSSSSSSPSSSSRRRHWRIR